MPRFMFGTNDEAEAAKIMSVMGHGSGTMATTPMPPAPRPTALPQPGGMPAMPGNSVAPPPPPAATPAPSANPRLENVVKLMDAYAKVNNVSGVRKVLAVVGLARAQDADNAQLEWLEQAFANTAWTPG